MSETSGPNGQAVRPALRPRLMDVPITGVYPVEVEEANALLVEWGHRLGPCNRPFHQEAYALEWTGRPIAVAISASIVNGPVAGYEREEVVELARLCACEPWANRVMLRLWREVCAPLWKCWPVRAAITYSHNTHTGGLYRFDGWKKIRDDAGSLGGGAWGRAEYASESARGRKTLWVWRYGTLSESN